MNLEDLKNPELQEKIKAAKTPEDLLALAREAGYELSDDELAGISGGFFWDSDSGCSNYSPTPNEENVSLPGGGNNYTTNPS